MGENVKFTLGLIAGFSMLILLSIFSIAENGYPCQMREVTLQQLENFQQYTVLLPQYIPEGMKLKSTQCKWSNSSRIDVILNYTRPDNSYLQISSKEYTTHSDSSQYPPYVYETHHVVTVRGQPGRKKVEMSQKTSKNVASGSAAEIWWIEDGALRLVRVFLRGRDQRTVAEEELWAVVNSLQSINEVVQE